MSDKAATWWAESTTRSKGTIAAFLALVVVLSGISFYVWSSPSNPVTQAVGSAVTAIDPVAAQNAKLKQRLATAQAALQQQKQLLSNTKSASATAQAAAAKQLADAQQKAKAAESALAAATAASASKRGSSTVKVGVPAPSGGSASGDGEAAVSITAPTKSELLQPASRYFGMYTDQAPFNWATLDATSANIGVQPDLVGYFSGWDQSFRANAVTRSWEKGRLPMMTWESRPIDAGNDTTSAPDYSLPKIIAGDFDPYLHQYARDIVSTGLPLVIRLDHEMNGIWYPWAETDGSGASINGNNVGDYVKMWRHVHDIFQQEGANDLVIWDWSPNIVNNLPAAHKGPGYLASLYPGDDYVDWVGLSGYLRPPYKADNDFTFDYTFGTSLDQLRALTKKPIMLSEIGASETGGHKATWITSLFQAFGDPKNDDILGFAWFNTAVTSYVEGVRATNDWRIDSRADTLAAFIAGLTRPEDRFDLIPAS
ncbi:glycoside hydrolase family 26 protein [Rathayibacter sp. KR2-224]|uniref:glycoside hydrolase family 26 protein n=1 Tax=Rathayibacter sp. KR2-224 TaxID=3400913 RepID=UPI003C0E9995